MVLSPNLQLSLASTARQNFEWRADVGPWRWLILSALGVAPAACGGHAEADPAASNGVNLESQGGTGGTQHPSTGVGGSGTIGMPGGVGGTSTVEAGGSGPTPEPTSTPSTCQNASELGGGWLRCDNGMLHRATMGTCPSSLPRPYPVSIPPGYAGSADAGVGAYPAQLSCRQDSDCTANAYGHCDWLHGQVSGSYCNDGCVVDADCGAGKVCVCGSLVGQCAPALCATDADCAGRLCGDYVSSPGCGGMAFACQTEADECAAGSDCTEHPYCTLDASRGSRVCSGAVCAIGRPFLVAGRERLASPVARVDWSSPAPADRTAGADIDAALRAELVRGWTEQGLMEHASVAAFARFSLQLLGLGAPPQLVARAAEAMQDEIRHAQACFGLARHYSGGDIGPGPLAIAGALEGWDLCSVVLSTLLEGCIGETVAALEAAEALAHCQHPATRAVLERIAVEESRHAELAWQFVAWALATGPEHLKVRVEQAFDAALASGGGGDVSPSTFELELLRRGILSAGLRAALRERVLAEVIAPCARSLLGRRQAANHVGAHEHVRLAPWA